MSILPRRDAESIGCEMRAPLDPDALSLAREVDEEIGVRGVDALRDFAQRWDGLQSGDPLFLERAELERARERLDSDEQALLERSAERIERFARAQLECLLPLDLETPEGRMGHRLEPLQSAGCYAPGGRYPLPSSVLMTVIPARVAEVREIVVATPRPSELMLATAAIAGADRVLCAGGAQAISALRRGTGPLPACDIIVGPGNAYVTAAKYLATAHTRIDMLAGPSELLVVASGEVDPETIAADLLAQAEHDVDARPYLVSEDAGLLDRVEDAMKRQLAELGTAEVARTALSRGGTVLVANLEEGIQVANRLAPEHLQLMGSKVEKRVGEFRSFGAVFVGSASGEVLGDYAAGPNHVLPTGATARTRGGLSVQDFLAVRSYLQLDDSEASRAMARDAESLALLEGLPGHARAAGRRALG